MNHQRFSKLLFLFAFFLLFLPTAFGKTFVHPGISHKLSDLERMKYMVKAGKEPWKTSFSLLQSNPFASLNYVPKWSLDSTRLVEGWPSNYNKFGDDTKAAYYHALQWYITGDARHAEKTIKIINNMRNVRDIESATQPLCAGRFAGKLIEAAEIIKSTYAGWKKEDIDAFKAMLVYPGYSTTKDYSTLPEHSFYWAMYNGDYGRAGNQGLFGFHGIIAMAIFMDNEIMYDRTVRYMKGMKHRPDDLPYPSGMTIRGNLSSSTRYTDNYVLKAPYTDNTVPDYGFNEQIQHYIWESGQCHESSRDQSHALLGVHLINCIAEIAWNQGDDLYSWLDNRLLLGLEFYFRYNLSYLYKFPDQPNAWEPTVESGEFIQRWDRSGRTLTKMINPYLDGYNIDSTIYITRGTAVKNTDVYGGKAPVFELALGHYKSRLGLSPAKYKWLHRSDSIFRKLHGYEQYGVNSLAILGFGGLTFHRADSCPGDPVTFVDKVPQFRQNIAPCSIQAEDYDIFSANGQNRTFFELSGTKIANEYRPDSAVTIKPIVGGGYKVSDIQAGEWLRYTVYVPEYSKYSVKLKYSAANANATIKLRIGKQDKTTALSLPATGNGVWSEIILLKDTLLSGIRSFQLIAGGESDVLELNSFSVERSEEPARNDYVTYQSGDYNTASNWRLSDGNGGVQASAPSAAPGTGNNVWIQSGHAMTATGANVLAKNMNVYGTLTVGSGTSTARNITLGTSTTPGSLYVYASGVLTSTTTAGTAAGTVSVYGNAVSNNGRIGSTNGTTTAGSGLRFLCFAPDTTFFSGAGANNIAGIQVGAALAFKQDIKISTNINILNTNTSGAALSLLNGTAELAPKSITITEGATVNFTGGSACLLHQVSSGVAQTVSTGDFNYYINGTLNTGAGGLYLTTANLAANNTQNLNLSVGSKGNLIIGTKFIMIKPYATQNINFTFNKGSRVVYSAESVSVMTSTPTATAAAFPVQYSSLTIDNPTGISLLSPAIITDTLTFLRGNLSLGANQLSFAEGVQINGSNTSKHIVINGSGLVSVAAKSGIVTSVPVGVSAFRFDPVEITPSASAVFTVRVDSVFDLAPLNASLANPTEWEIKTSENVSAVIGLQPSKNTAISNPVIALQGSGKWTEFEATLNEAAFTATFTQFGKFATGTKTAYGLLSAIDYLLLNGVKMNIEQNTLKLANLSPDNKINVFSSGGISVYRGESDGGRADIVLPAKGVYVVELITAEKIKCRIKVVH